MSSLVSEVASYLVVISAIASPVAVAVVFSAVEFAEKAFETVAAQTSSTGVKALIARFSVRALSIPTVSSESSESTESTTKSC